MLSLKAWSRLTNQKRNSKLNPKQMFNLSQHSGANTSTQTVLETTSYDDFGYITGNREIDEPNVKSLTHQIAQRGQLQPIIVNEKKQVIDGQHRVEVCRRLEIPVQYVVRPGASIADVISANVVGKKWRPIDYVRRYAAENNDHYVKLLAFIEKCQGHKISATSAIHLTRGGHSDSTYYHYDDGTIRKHSGTVKAKKLGIAGTDVKIGRFKMPSERVAEQRLRAVIQFKQWPFYRQTSFINALLQVMRIADFKLKRLIDNAQRYPSRFTKEPDVESFVQMFETVYNYRRSDKLPFVNHPERRK